MYTKLDDWRHAHKVNEVLQDKPNATKSYISSKLGLCDARLNYLHKVGLINIQHTKRRYANEAKTNNPVCE
jgi:hypothetical protein